MSVQNNESISISDTSTQKAAPPAEEAKLVSKFLDDTNSGMPKTTTAANNRDFFNSGNFDGNTGDLMMAAMNDPGKFYNDPRFQAFLKAQQRGQHTTVTDTKTV